MDDLVKRSDVLEALDLCDFVRDNEYQNGACLLFRESVIEVIKALPPAKQAKESTYAQSIEKCETCYYWGNRIMMRDGSLGDCGNFGVSLSKDFYCAWWSQKEKEDEQDG